MKNTFIYTISDENGVIRYIGKSNNPKNRLYTHIKETSNMYKFNWLKSIIKRGAFPIVEILEEVPSENWQFYEKYWISQFRAWGFKLINLTDGGEGSEGYKHSLKSRNKMRKSKLGGRLSSQHRKSISNSIFQKSTEYPNYNKCQDKIHEINKDLLYQKYIVENLSLNKCAKFFNTSKHTIFRNITEQNFKKDKEDWRHQLSSRKKSIYNQYTTSGEFIREYIGQGSLSESGFNAQSVMSCCKGRSNISQGYIWRFPEDVVFREKNNSKVSMSVVQIKDGEVINKFDSIKSASKNTKIQRSSIGYCCKGFLKSAGGYIWKYETNI